MASIYGRNSFKILFQRSTRSKVPQTTNGSISQIMLQRNCSPATPPSFVTGTRHMGGFSFAGPQKLEEVMKTDLLTDKTKAEVSDIWMTYHEDKERVHGSFVSGQDGKLILERANNLNFFIQPIFRESGFFMLLSQFQKPSHFLMAYLEDYKMDPNRAQPLMTFSIFNDLVESHDISLVRCDIINKGIEEDEGRKVMESMIDAYRIDEDYTKIKAFNEQPATFDVDDFVACMNQKWKPNNGDGNTIEA